MMTTSAPRARLFTGPVGPTVIHHNRLETALTRIAVKDPSNVPGLIEGRDADGDEPRGKRVRGIGHQGGTMRGEVRIRNPPKVLVPPVRPATRAAVSASLEISDVERTLGRPATLCPTIVPAPGTLSASSPTSSQPTMAFCFDVTLFFVLSGYLITELLLAERAAVGHVDLRSFYVRRGLRLFPALVALLLVVAVGSLFGLWTSAGGDMALAIPAVLADVGNWAQVAGLSMGPLGHTWSLAIEEQFYLIWPITLLVALRLDDRRMIGLLAVLVALLITPWRVELLLAGALGHAFAGTDAHADSLLMGCAIALLQVKLPAPAGWVGLLGIIVSGALWSGGGGLVFMLPIATAAAVLAIAGCPKPISWGPMAHVGRISYGLYLWHLLFIWWGLQWPVVFALSFMAAEASYAAIERPFLRLKDRFRPAAPAPSAAFVDLAPEPAAIS